MTKKTAISLPDDLFREIERARKRAKKDRSTWIQEAASDYLKRKTMQEKIDAYFDGYRRIPDGDDPDFIAMENNTIAKARLVQRVGRLSEVKMVELQEALRFALQLD